MGFYTESVDRPYTSAVVAEDIDVGELGALNASGNAEAFDFASHTEEQLLGVATQPLSGQQVRLDDDDTGGFTYLTAEDDRASFAGEEDRAVIKVKTAEDNGTDPAPSISHGDVVGVIDTSSTISSAAEFQGRLVQEGYTDDGATTYDRGAGNFYALGTAYRDDSTAFDDPVRVQVNKDLN